MTSNSALTIVRDRRPRKHAFLVNQVDAYYHCGACGRGLTNEAHRKSDGPVVMIVVMDQALAPDPFALELGLSLDLPRDVEPARAEIRANWPRRAEAAA